jgi:hypothetical protein
MTFRSKYNINSLEGTFNICLKAIAYSSVLYFCSFITADTDLWGHIKFGKDLWISKTLSPIDIYSYTAYGEKWINHEWLSEVIMYLVFDIFGSPGLLIGKLLIGLLIVYILSRISIKRTFHSLAYGPVFVLTVFVMSPGFMTRPQILTFLFTSLFLYVFHLYFDMKKDYLWSLPLIMILWVNCHGGFLIGLGMFPVVVIGEIIYCVIRKRNTGYLRRLILWLMITEVSVLINPYGYRLLMFLYETLAVPRNIWEWNPINIFDASYLRFKIVAISVILALFVGRKQTRYWEIGIIAITMVYAFLHQRHTPIFAIVAAPYLTDKISILITKINLYNKLESKAAYAMLNIVLAILIGYQLFYTSNKYINARFNIIVDPRMYPVYAVHFLKENRIKGDILLPFEWGEYVLWKLYPDCKVSIDGRFRTAYPEEVLDDHFGAIKDESRWKALLDKYPTDIILARRSPFFRQLMSRGDEWVYVYSNRNSIVFIKNEDSQKNIIERLKRKELTYSHQGISIYFP